MALQHAAQHPGHVGVAGVDFVDDQQAPRERSRPEMRPLHAQAREQHLVDGSDGRRGGQKLPGALGRPAREARPLVRFVLPEDVESADPFAFSVACSVVPGHGEHRFDLRVGRDQPGQCLFDPDVELLRRRSRRHREVQSVDEALAPQRGETQDGGFRLA